MVNRKKVFSLGVAAFAVLVGVGTIWHYVSLRIENNIITNVYRLFGSGDTSGALNESKRLRFVDKNAETFYVANLDLSQSLEHAGNAHGLQLDAAKVLTMNVTSRNKYFRRDYLFLKASISSILGDNSAAVKYASEACKLSDKKDHLDLEPCLSSRYFAPSLSYDVNYSKWEALRMFEWSSLYDSIGKGDKSRSKYYEIISLRYFDMRRAHALRQDMIKNGTFTSDMARYYCKATVPVEDSVCAKK